MTSASGIADRCVESDGGSNDGIISISGAAGSNVLVHPWVDNAAQVNWALDQLPADTEWVLRLDADENVTESLARQIASVFPKLWPGTAGVYVGRRINFMGCCIRLGCLFPVRVLRLFRHGHGRSESRWTDEDITIDGQTANLQGEVVDASLKTLSWWAQKQNVYASRRVVDLLVLDFGFVPSETVADLRGGQQAGVKHWVKESIYDCISAGHRAREILLYRYVLKRGFLKGSGTGFHGLRGFWCR